MGTPRSPTDVKPSSSDGRNPALQWGAWIRPEFEDPEGMCSSILAKKAPWSQRAWVRGPLEAVVTWKLDKRQAMGTCHRACVEYLWERLFSFETLNNWFFVSCIMFLELFAERNIEIPSIRLVQYYRTLKPAAVPLMSFARLESQLLS